METLKRLNGRMKGFASLANIGSDLYEVNLVGEVYRCATSRRSMRCKAERVDRNRWKIYKRTRSGNPIECVMRTNVLVGCAWWNIDESVWENSTYADTIRRCKEFFSIPNEDKQETKYQTKNGFSYCVTRYGEVWSTESMIKLKGCNGHGYRCVNLGSVNGVVAIHRLVAKYFVAIPEDLLAQGLTEETLVVNHLDGNKLNNRWDNLEWTTHDGNMAHASATGLMHTTIDDHLLEHIFKRLQDGYSNVDISRETGIPDRVVNDIRRGRSRRYRTDKYTWPKPKHSSKLDKATIFSIYDEFTYTDKSNREIGRQYNVSNPHISRLRLGHRQSDLACEYITSKGLAGYWQGYRHPK